MALDLQGRGHLPVGDGKRLGRDDEAANPLDRPQTTIDPRDHGADRLSKSRVASKQGNIGRGPVLGGETGDELGIRNQNRDEVRPLVAKHDCLGNFRLQR